MLRKKIYLLSIGRYPWVIGALIASVALFVTYWVEWIYQLEPCSLCLLQRWILIALTFWFFLGILPLSFLWIIRVHSLFGAALSALGACIAARHLWLISYPPTHHLGCEANINYLLHYLPIQEAIKMVLKGLPDCTQASSSLLGLYLPTWAFIVFSILFGISLLSFIRQMRQP